MFFRIEKNTISTIYLTVNSINRFFFVFVDGWFSSRRSNRCSYGINSISSSTGCQCSTSLTLIEWIPPNRFRLLQVFVDTVGDPEKYATKIRTRFPKIKVTVSKKADSLYPIVSASSICAKVIRDQIVQTWKLTEFDDTKEILPYGSGYPGGREEFTREIDAVSLPNHRSSNETIFEWINRSTVRFSEIRSIQLVNSIDDDRKELHENLLVNLSFDHSSSNSFSLSLY